MKKDVYGRKDYVWLNITPGTRKLRDGSVLHNTRGAEQWTKALNNHIRVSHRGQEQESCAGCRELKQKLRESMEK